MADIVGRNGQREEFRVVGKPNKPGILSYALASGVAKFGADYTAPDMLHAKFLRSPYAHARVRSIGTEKAWKVPGVVDIVLWDDPDLMGLGGMPFGPKKSYLGNVAHQENQEVGAIVVAESEDAWGAKSPTKRGFYDWNGVDMEAYQKKVNAPYWRFIDWEFPKEECK